MYWSSSEIQTLHKTLHVAHKPEMKDASHPGHAPAWHCCCQPSHPWLKPMWITPHLQRDRRLHTPKFSWHQAEGERGLAYGYRCKVSDVWKIKPLPTKQNKTRICSEPLFLFIIISYYSALLSITIFLSPPLQKRGALISVKFYSFYCPHVDWF